MPAAPAPPPFQQPIPGVAPGAHPVDPQGAPWPEFAATPPTAGDPAADRRRRWLSGALGIVGGFVVVSTVTSQLPVMLSGVSNLPVGYLVLTLVQGLFGIAVVVVAFLAAPGPMASRGIAAGIFVVVVVVVVVLQAVRMTTGAHPVVATLVFNPWAWLVLAGGFGWLLAVRVPPKAYLSLLAVIVLFLPINFGLMMASVEAPINTLVMQAISLAVAAVILIVGARARHRVAAWGSPV